MAIVSGTLGRFYSHGTLYTGFTSEAATISLGSNQYQINDTTMRWWRPESPITVATADGGTSGNVASTAYTRIDLGGIIDFKGTVAPIGTVQVSGTYYPMSHVGGFREWSFSMSREMVEVTRQGSVQWQEFVAGPGAVEASASGFWINNFFFSTVDPAAVWLAVFYVDYDSGKRYEGQTYITSHDVGSSYDSVATEDVSFTLTEAPKYYASNS